EQRGPVDDHLQRLRRRHHMAHLVCVRRRSSSKKFSRKNTWFREIRSSRPSTGISATIRLPSGARSKLRKFASTFCSDHSRGLSAANESPLTLYAATMIRSCSLKNSSRPARDHTGDV